MSESELRAAAEKVRELSGDISDTLNGWQGPGDGLTYRGTLLHELLGAALVLRKAVVARCPAGDGVPWRLISAAPKDGTVVLVGALGQWPRVAFWCDRGCWMMVESQGGSVPYTPTHWLPEPPPLKESPDARRD